MNEDLRKNGSGCPDPTAYEAIKNAENDGRFYKLLSAIFNMCELADFHLEEHIVVKDKRTGKIWR